MRYLKYECKFNFVKLPLIWIYQCLKLIFENATLAATQAAARLWIQLTPPFPAPRSYRSSVEITRTLWWQTRFTRRRVREWKSGHNSVTVQNLTHVYMNFFDHKDLGNHLLQLCPKSWNILYINLSLFSTICPYTGQCLHLEVRCYLPFWCLFSISVKPNSPSYN
jgi:hypothetical protein